MSLLTDRDVRFNIENASSLYRIIEYCYAHNRPPSECQSGYFKDASALKPILSYWALATDMDEALQYKILLDDGKTVTVQNGQFLNTDDGFSIENPVTMNTSFLK